MKWIKKGVIFEPPGNIDWIVTHAAVPIAYHLRGDTYRIYFSGRDHLNRAQVGYFEMDINYPGEILCWSDKPVLGVGKLGTFDESGAMGDWIIAQEGNLFLYYTGWNLGVTVPFRNAIGLAVSQDGGRTFIKYSKGPILDRNIHDPCFVSNSCVFVDKKKWRMWYLSCDQWKIESNTTKHYYHIKYAESDDGIHWERDGILCVDFKSEDEYAISRPCVLKNGGKYKMWYSYRGQSYRIGYAESDDGIEWERKDDEAGIDVSESGWDSEMIEYPFVFEHDGERYMLYNGNGYGKTGIGLAVLEK
jgi:predicted GH43/DUF377 family glycosyl hydrolase